jgi:hypothetical protein
VNGLQFGTPSIARLDGLIFQCRALLGVPNHAAICNLLDLGNLQCNFELK